MIPGTVSGDFHLLIHLDDHHPMATWLETKNLARQYDFMNSSFVLWAAQQPPEMTLEFIRDLNFYAAHYLSPHPGRFRGDGNSYNVIITNTPHVPPSYDLVEQLMQEFISRVASLNATREPTFVAAYVLWRLNWIHPFAQGNGRTARAASYFLLCQRYRKWFPGTPVLELIRRERSEYCRLLAEADATVDRDGMADLVPIQRFLERLLMEQIQSALSLRGAGGAKPP